MLFQIKVVDGLDQSDASNLEEIVAVLSPAGKPLDHREHQPEVALDQFLPGLLVPCLGPAQQLPGTLPGEQRQLGGVHAADVDLALQKNASPSQW